MSALQDQTNLVRNLAENSRLSTEQITAIWQSIQDKTNEVAAQAALGRDAMEGGLLASGEVGQLIRDVAANADQAEQQAMLVRESSEKLEHAYRTIKDETMTIAGITEENMASVQEITSSIETHDGKITAREQAGSGLPALFYGLKPKASMRIID